MVDTATAPEELIRPFSCGTQHADWEGRNCDRCWKRWTESGFRCSLQKALSLAAIGDGTISAKVAKRIGYPGPLVFGWDCPERQEKRPAPKNARVPREQGRLDLVPAEQGRLPAGGEGA